MKLKKRAVVMPFLVILILALLILLFMGPLSGTIAATLNRGADVEKCRLSVLSHSTSSGKFLVPLKCPRRQLTFYDNKVNVNGKMMKKYDFDKLDNEIVNKIIAEELRLCWYKMGVGDINVFMPDFAASKNVCVVCTEINFDKSVKSSTSFKGLFQYLDKDMPSSKISYKDYITKSQEKYKLNYLLPWTQYYSPASSNMVPPDISFNPSKEYAIYFLGFNPSMLSELVVRFNFINLIGVDTPDKLETICGSLQN